jgi:cysteinyl-tRNA synthetase
MLEGLKDKIELYPRLIELLLSIRNRFRKEKDYESADFIRDLLLEQRISIDDQGLDKSTYRLEVK